MKSVRIHEYGDVDQLKYEEAPDPQPGAGEILVQLAATSINPIDWKVLSGGMQQYFPLSFPAILGRDIAGTVKQVGPGVTQFHVGDRVMALGEATFAELVVGKAGSFARVPRDLDLVEAAALPLVTLTGVGLVELGIGVRKGERVLVTGALGGVGRSAVYAAKLAGAKVIAGVRKSEFEKADELGADDLLALDDPAQIAKLSPVDAIADTVGPAVTANLLARLKPGGRLVTVTEPPPNAAQFPQVKASGFHVTADGKRLARIAEDVIAKHLRIPIDRRLPMAQAHLGMAAARKGGIGKVLLLP